MTLHVARIELTFLNLVQRHWNQIQISLNYNSTKFNSTIGLRIHWNKKWDAHCWRVEMRCILVKKALKICSWIWWLKNSFWKDTNLKRHLTLPLILGLVFVSCLCNDSYHTAWISSMTVTNLVELSPSCTIAKSAATRSWIATGEP